MIVPVKQTKRPADSLGELSEGTLELKAVKKTSLKLFYTIPLVTDIFQKDEYAEDILVFLMSFKIILLDT